MATLRDDGDRISISLFDIRLLVVLLAGPMHAYGLARQCEADDPDHTKISNGTVYSAIKSLVLLGLIDEVDQPVGSRYEITSHGKLVLEHEIKRLSELVSAAQERGLS